jgi:hypothetical protein
MNGREQKGTSGAIGAGESTRAFEVRDSAFKSPTAYKEQKGRPAIVRVFDSSVSDAFRHLLKDRSG